MPSEEVWSNIKDDVLAKLDELGKALRKQLDEYIERAEGQGWTVEVYDAEDISDDNEQGLHMASVVVEVERDEDFEIYHDVGITLDYRSKNSEFGLFDPENGNGGYLDDFEYYLSYSSDVDDVADGTYLAGCEVEDTESGHCVETLVKGLEEWDAEKAAKAEVDGLLQYVQENGGPMQHKGKTMKRYHPTTEHDDRPTVVIGNNVYRRTAANDAHYDDQYLKGTGVMFFIYALVAAKNAPKDAFKQVKSIPREVASDLDEETKEVAMAHAKKGKLWFLKMDGGKSGSGLGWDWTQTNGAKNVLAVQAVLDYLRKFESKKTVGGVEAIHIEINNKQV